MTYTHEQISALMAGRTPGEWIADGFGCKDTVFTDSQEYGICYDMMNEADAEFIAAAPDIVAQLLDYQAVYETIKPSIDRLQKMKLAEYGDNVISVAADEIERLQKRVEELEAENELLRQSRDGLLSLGVHAVPFIEPTNRQLSNLLEGIRAVLRVVADD